MRPPAVLLVALCLMAAPGWAQNGVQSLEQAVAKVKKDSGVRVLTASEVDNGGRKQFRIKILDKKGHVRNIYIDAQQ